MNSFEYLKSKLEKFVIDFSTIQCRVEYLDFSKSYFIEILPVYSYNNDEVLNEKITDIIFEFDELFLEETISFITKDDIYVINNPCLIVKGKLYDEFAKMQKFIKLKSFSFTNAYKQQTTDLNKFKSFSNCCYTEEYVTAA